MPRDRSRDDDEYEEEERPKKKRKRRDDDDDDDDERPKRKKGDSGGGGFIWVMLGVGLLMVFAVAIGGFLLFRGGKKKTEPEVVERQRPDAGPTQEDPSPRPKPKSSERDATKSPMGVGIPSLTSTVTQIVFAGGGDGHAAIVSNKTMEIGHNFDIVKTSTGKTLGRVQNSDITVNGCAVSPDGNLLAVMGLKPFEGNPISLFLVASGQLLKEFTPYSKVKKITAPDLEWVSFISKDQLLTINTGGGFDVWSVPDMKKTAGLPAPLKAGSRIDVDHFTQSPKNFCLSIDGKTLAIFNGSGFTIYNTETAAELVKTQDILQSGSIPLFYAAAFSPDGKRFACYYQVFVGKSTSILLNIWDSKNGSLITAAGGSLKKGDKFPAGFAWWGSSHLVFWEGGVASGAVFSIDSGQLAGDLKTSIPGKFGTVPPNGQLWAIVGPGGYDPEKGKGFLVHIDVPLGLRPGVTFELTQEGLKTK